MFQSAYWRRLGIHDVRYTTPWDTLRDPRQLALLDAWMTQARRSHVRVLLGLAHSLRSEKLAHRLPTLRQFGRQFRRLRQRYPDVRDWVVWNEANNPGALTARRPRRAARYFDAVARSCRRCRIVAADLLDSANMVAWVKAFQRSAHFRPRIWGLHNYSDTNGLRRRNTQKLLAITTGRIWFTETGGVVLRRTYAGHKVLRTYRHSLEHAAKATTYALRLTCLSPRVKRVYLYHWQTPPTVTNWDSGLLDRRGRPRPAYFALQRWLRRARTTRSAGRAICPRHR
jgi:hypothetical protein